MLDGTELYKETIKKLRGTTLLVRDEKKQNPRDFIVATHGPALTRAIEENPSIVNYIGIYRVNCSHLGKETDLNMLGEYLRALHLSVPILIDLQGPKPRIHEVMPGTSSIPVKIGDRFEVTYEDHDSENRFCKAGRLKVCFPEIVEVMEVGDIVIFDDGKMTAIVREKGEKISTIECSEILSGEELFFLGGRKGICVRNKPLGIECITDHDRKSVEFSRDILGFEYVDNIMVSYFSTPGDIEHFVKIIRDEYGYTGNLGGKFETPHAVYNIDKILELHYLTLAMFGRGDLRVEMDPRALKNMHDIQVHFFTSCEKHRVESICATGFLESMITKDGTVTTTEMNDMHISVLSGADHLMLSGESTYGAQAAACVKLETEVQRTTQEQIQSGKIAKKVLPSTPLSELLYIQ